MSTEHSNQTSKTWDEEERYTAAAIHHERAVARNKHVEHGVKAHLVESSPDVIVATNCPCGAFFTTTNGAFSAGSRSFYEVMENPRDAE